MPTSPGARRAGSKAGPTWGLHAHRPDAYFIALEDGRLLGYGYLQLEGETWSNGFMAVAREARGRGVAGALKRAQIRWAKEQGIATLRTANEVRLDSMLDLNRRFGYLPLYEEIVLRGAAGAKRICAERRSTALCKRAIASFGSSSSACCSVARSSVRQRTSVAACTRAVLVPSVGEERELADDLAGPELDRSDVARLDGHRSFVDHEHPRSGARAARSARVPRGTSPRTSTRASRFRNGSSSPPNTAERRSAATRDSRSTLIDASLVVLPHPYAASAKTSHDLGSCSRGHDWG